MDLPSLGYTWVPTRSASLSGRRGAARAAASSYIALGRNQLDLVTMSSPGRKVLRIALAAYRKAYAAPSKTRGLIGIVTASRMLCANELYTVISHLKTVPVVFARRSPK